MPRAPVSDSHAVCFMPWRGLVRNWIGSNFSFPGLLGSRRNYLPSVRPVLTRNGCSTRVDLRMKFSPSQIIFVVRLGCESIIISRAQCAMWTNAATLWCKIYSQESTSSCATGLCSIDILAVGETGRLAWCLKIIIGRRDARLPHRQDACATIDRISATAYDQQ